MDERAQAARTTREVMAKKPSPPIDDQAESPVSRDEVSALRALSREDRLALLMKDFDASSGVAPLRRRPAPASEPPPKAPKRPGKA